MKTRICDRCKKVIPSAHVKAATAGMKPGRVFDICPTCWESFMGQPKPNLKATRPKSRVILDIPLGDEDIKEITIPHNDSGLGIGPGHSRR